MHKQEIFYLSKNNKTNIRAMKYYPEGSVKAILQIAHGMVEFIDRYEDFAKYLTENGFLVVGNDHLGHGGSVESKNDWGYFGENGNQVLIDDMYELTKITKQEYNNVPYFLLGHSMGSFYARQYIVEHSDELNGVIIMGTGLEPLIKLKAAMVLCKLIGLLKGDRYRSKLINDMAFGAFNKQFTPARTKMDWLTKDENIVDWYLNEPRCTFVFSVNAFYNMFKGISRLHDKTLLSKINKDLPVLFVSGKCDPVGANGKEVINSLKTLENVGMKDLSIKLYEDDRHEILNETDRLDVYKDLYDWMNKYI